VVACFSSAPPGQQLGMAAGPCGQLAHINTATSQTMERQPSTQQHTSRDTQEGVVASTARRQGEDAGSA
jgi:hypothetical protein